MLFKITCCSCCIFTFIIYLSPSCLLLICCFRFPEVFASYSQDISLFHVYCQYVVSEILLSLQYIKMYHKDISLLHVYSQYVVSVYLLKLQRIHIYHKDISIVHVFSQYVVSDPLLACALDGLH